MTARRSTASSPAVAADPPPPAGRPTPAWLPRIALACALASVLALATRLVANNDIGYHLAYGESFLDGGRPVDSGEFVFARPEHRTGDPALDLGPGCWYDADGAYRFPNANWLSQVVLALVWRAAASHGPAALSLVLVALVATIVALATATMRRAGVPAVWIALGVLAMALAAEGRFVLRPEVFGYAVMAAQLFLLLPLCETPRAPTWKWVALGTLLQGLLVNLHGYAMIGLGLTGAVLIDRVIARGGPGRPESVVVQTRRLSALLGLQVLVCFANPWTWRLAVLPLDTLAYIRRNGIASGGGSHPWSSISEFASPIVLGRAALLRLDAVLVIVLLVVTAVAGLKRRRFGHVLIVAGMTAVGLSMQRNLALAALLATPVALVAAREWLARALPGGPRRRAEVWAASAIVLGSIALTALVVTQGFYRRTDSLERFGLGLSRLNVPLGPAAWISAHLPQSQRRIWTDFNSSSNVHYFTSPRREVPLLTNTWAVPPSVMGDVLRVNAGEEPFAETFARYGVECVVLEIYGATERLAVSLAGSSSWALVDLDAVYATFLRVGPATLDVARRFSITPSSLDLEAHARRLRGADPVATDGLFAGAWTLARLGASTPAITLLRQVVAERAEDARAWSVLGATLFLRAENRLRRDDRGGADDLVEARDCLRRVLEIDPEHPQARDNLLALEQRLAQLGG